MKLSLNGTIAKVLFMKNNLFFFEAFLKCTYMLSCKRTLLKDPLMSIKRIWCLLGEEFLWQFKFLTGHGTYNKYFCEMVQ